MYILAVFAIIIIISIVLTIGICLTVPTIKPIEPFITRWTCISGETIVMPFTSDGTYDITINWGDGTEQESYSTHEVSHTYMTTGTFDVRVNGTMTLIDFGPSDEVTIDAFTGVVSGGTTGLTISRLSFENADNITVMDNSPWTANVTDMRRCFKNAPSFDLPLDKWDVSKVENMDEMFLSYAAGHPLYPGTPGIFNQPIDVWNVSRCKTFKYMFINQTLFNQPLNNWDMSNAISISHMFAGCTKFNQNINTWNTSSIEDMESVFQYATSFNQPLNNWDTSSVTTMEQMFRDSVVFNQTINTWDTSNVTDMYEMLLNSNYDQPFDMLDYTAVTDVRRIIGMETSVNNYSDFLVSFHDQRKSLVIPLSLDSISQYHRADVDALTQVSDVFVQPLDDLGIEP